MGAVSTWPLLHHTKPTGFFTFVESFFFENKKHLCGYHRRRTELSKHNFVLLFFLVSSYRRKQHKKFIVYLPSFPQCNHLGPRVLANGGRSLSVLFYITISVSMAYVLLTFKNLMSVSKVDDEEKPVRLPLDEKPDRCTLTIHPDISAQRSLTPDRLNSKNS